MCVRVWGGGRVYSASIPFHSAPPKHWISFRFINPPRPKHHTFFPSRTTICSHANSHIHTTPSIAKYQTLHLLASVSPFPPSIPPPPHLHQSQAKFMVYNQDIKDCNIWLCVQIHSFNSTKPCNQMVSVYLVH